MTVLAPTVNSNVVNDKLVSAVDVCPQPSFKRRAEDDSRLFHKKDCVVTRIESRVRCFSKCFTKFD